MAHLQCAKIVSGSKFEVFDYLTSPAMLCEQFRGLIDVKWQNPGIELQQGAEFLFLMTRFGVEQPVRLVIDRMVVGNSLTYHQISGVYSKLSHTMKFEEHGQNETLVTETVEYELPFGLIGRMIDDFFVFQDFKKIIEHRLSAAQNKFEAVRMSASGLTDLSELSKTKNTVTNNKNH
ncbi:MAG: hypothetical protein ABL927_09190 [Bdellovibrionales bacterium]